MGLTPEGDPNLEFIRAKHKLMFLVLYYHWNKHNDRQTMILNVKFGDQSTELFWKNPNNSGVFVKRVKKSTCSKVPKILHEVMYLKNLTTDSQSWREDAPNDFPRNVDNSSTGTLKMSTALARG